MPILLWTVGLQLVTGDPRPSRVSKTVLERVMKGCLRTMTLTISTPCGRRAIVVNYMSSLTVSVGGGELLAGADVVGAGEVIRGQHFPIVLRRC